MTLKGRSSKKTSMDAPSSLLNTAKMIMNQMWHVRGFQSLLPYAIFITKILEHFRVSLDGETKVALNLRESKVDIEHHTDRQPAHTDEPEPTAEPNQPESHAQSSSSAAMPTNLMIMDELIHTIKTTKPPFVCEYKLWVEFLHDILFPHFFHPTLNTRESRTAFRAVVCEVYILFFKSRNLPFHSVPDFVSDYDSISDSILVSLHSVQYTDFVHFVALSDSEHSENSVHSKNMAQPPTPPGPRERTLRELVAPDFTYDSLCIQYPNEDVPYECKRLSVGVIFGTKDILDITNLAPDLGTVLMKTPISQKEERKKTDKDYRRQSFKI
ncbi:hypothetical protein Lal_00042346 [Lupinus albus]|nr:hypothetical protein Lal_00042346 [Lupinus albus]